MLEQGSGHIYNMEGYGSDDSMMPGVTLYGTTKRAVRYITESLIEEAKDTPVRLGTLRPGMVITDLLLNDFRKMSKEKFEEVKPIFNALADKVETITPFLVENILKDDKTGAIIEWLPVEKANARFADENYLSRDMFSEYGL
jgi:NADP-dependent 3-hydroxy acid dehydrogenase YdfG